MSHSYSKIWIHGIWATKLRNRFILPKIEDKVYDYLKEELKELDCSPYIINGMPDHVHALFLLNPMRCVGQVIKQVKGCTSHSINEANLLSEKFCWQTGYAAYSVCESKLKQVYNYIKNQKKHHLRMDFQQEFEYLARLHNVGVTPG